MSLFGRLGKSFIKELSPQLSQEVDAKVRVGIAAALQAIDASMPVIADALAGNPARVRIVIPPIVIQPIEIDVQLVEVSKGAAFTGPKP